MVSHINFNHYQHNPFVGDPFHEPTDQELLPLLQETLQEIKEDIAQHEQSIEDLLAKLDTLHAHYLKLDTSFALHLLPSAEC